MKKLCILLSLCLVLSGCATQNAAVQTTTGSVQCQNQHIDTENDGFCDRCSKFLLIFVDFYNINDLHGKIDDANTHPGVDELSTYLENAKEENEYTILLSSGDMWQGSSESNLTHGLLMTDWMNEMGFAAMAMGNHEYDWGEDHIATNDTQAQFPYLAINIYDRETDQRVSYCDSSTMVDLGLLQIGIIGAIGDCYSSISADKTTGVYFKTGSDLTQLVKSESEKLRNDGADFIVYLLHDGYEKSSNNITASSKQLSGYYDTALSQGYVDLVFEGHTHQKYILQDQQGIYHLQGGGDNEGITHAQVAINIANGNAQVQTAEHIPTNKYAALDDSPLVDQLLNKYADAISVGSQVLGRNTYARNRNELRQIAADLYYEKGLELWGDKYDIVLGGGYMSVRDPGYLAAGSVTYSMLYSLFPFDNQLVLCSIQGRDLTSRFINTDNSNYFISYDTLGNIDPNATYYIVVDTYSSQYKPNNLTEIARYDAEIYARDLLAEYAAAGGFN